MRRTAMGRSVLLSVIGLCAFTGCTQIVEKLKGMRDGGIGGDDDPSALADAATTTVTGTGAKNEADVLRYEREEPIANEPASIAKDETKVRTIPGSGSVVATLAKGTPVVKVAKYFATGVLVAFDDPAGGTLLGWVPPSALATAAAATGSVAHVPATPVTTGTATAPRDAGTKPVDAGAVDAGAAKIADAGAPKAADAGAAAKVADAGAKPAPAAAAEPKKTDVIWQPSGGKCPTGFFLSGPMCRRKCATTEADCPRGFYCIAGQGGKYCSTDKK